MRVKMDKHMLKLDYKNIVGKFNIDDYEIFGMNKNNLTCLILTNNKLIELYNLPPEIIFINCSYNNIEVLDNIPFNLKILLCRYNKVKSLDYLPE